MHDAAEIVELFGKARNIPIDLGREQLCYDRTEAGVFAPITLSTVRMAEECENGRAVIEDGSERERRLVRL
jgi:hypothetical protein